MFRSYLSRDDVLALISVIDDETGLGRGSIGQCVEAIIQLAPKRATILESIAADLSVDDRKRFRAILLLVSILQWKQLEHCAEIITRIIGTFPDDGPDEEREKIAGILETLKGGDLIDFS
jgi:hypothetical protein